MTSDVATRRALGTLTRAVSVGGGGVQTVEWREREREREGGRTNKR